MTLVVGMIATMKLRGPRKMILGGHAPCLAETASTTVLGRRTGHRSGLFAPTQRLPSTMTAEAMGGWPASALQGPGAACPSQHRPRAADGGGRAARLTWGR